MGSFSVGLFPNGACEFPRTPLSSDHSWMGLVARPAWISSWQRRQITTEASPRTAELVVGLVGDVAVEWVQGTGSLTPRRYAPWAPS